MDNNPVDRLATPPTHLFNEDESPEDIRKEIEETTAVPELKKPEVKLDDPRGEREYTFTLDHTDGRGKLWTGQFVNQILSLAQKQMVGVLRARFSGGLPYEALDPLTAEINLMMAHLTYSLKENPKWADNLRELDDVAVVQALYGRVASHEAYFLGYRSFEDGGAEKPAAGDGSD